MNLQAIARRIAGQDLVREVAIRRSAITIVADSGEEIDPGRYVAPNKNETVINPSSLSQTEFIASHRARGEDSMIDFADLLVHAENNGGDPEDYTEDALRSVMES